MAATGAEVNAVRWSTADDERGGGRPGADGAVVRLGKDVETVRFGDGYDNIIHQITTARRPRT